MLCEVLVPISENDGITRNTLHIEGPDARPMAASLSATGGAPGTNDLKSLMRASTAPRKLKAERFPNGLPVRSEAGTGIASISQLLFVSTGI